MTMIETERQFLHEILFRGENAMKKLQDATVILSGCGAVGTYAGTILARAGVSRFRLIDRDVVAVHNLSTQLFLPSDLGKSKVAVLQRILYGISKARAETQKIELTMENAEALLAKSDAVLCSFDNRAGRLAVKKACLKLQIPCVFAGMNGKDNYFEVIWAENYMVPRDPPETEIDPCNYPLSAPLVALTSAVASEIILLYLINGEKNQCRIVLNDFIKA